MPGNSFLTRQEFTRETLLILTNNLKVAPNIHRGYDDQYGVKGAKIGQTLNIRRPVRFKGRNGQGFAPEGIVETFIPLTLNYQSGVDFEMSSVERKLDMDYLRERILKPAAVNIANRVDGTLLYLLYQQTGNVVGTPGTVPNSSATYLTAPQIIHEMGAPVDDELSILISPQMQATIINAVQNLFHDGGQLSRQYKQGKMGTAWGMEWYEDQQIYVHTIGTYGGAPLVNGANQQGNVLTTDGWNAGSTLNVGDVIYLSGVFAVNPQPGPNGQPVVYARQQGFVVAAPAVADGAGNMVIQIGADGIIPSGQYQNVNALPADNAPITVFGASGTNTPQAMAFHKSAYAMATVPLEEPGGVEEAFTETDPDTGISLRYVRQYVATTDQYANRFDILWGECATYPQLATRIAS
ncbi:MAG TPA: P22 phage major capsid protein family protein [Candidatus Kapabacteria bacterium]|nr:P22 phage major capsid protein family protein [Candidatus Kapabacteria bacterium]